MDSSETFLYEMLYPQFEHGGRRFTQDTPVLAEVWLAFAKQERVDILINPHNQVGVGGLLRAIEPRLDSPEHRLAYNESHVVVSVTLEELLEVVLPQSAWWQKVAKRGDAKAASALVDKLAAQPSMTFDQWRRHVSEFGRQVHPTDADLIQLVDVAAAVIMLRSPQTKPTNPGSVVNLPTQLVKPSLLRALANVPKQATLWTVSKNRATVPALWQSRETIKADAAIRVFDVKCNDICWAVIDSGMDATHPAFLRHGGKNGETKSRVLKTYDFTRLRELLSTPTNDNGNKGLMSGISQEQRTKIRATLRERLKNGLQVDWDTIAPLLEVKHYFEEVVPSNKKAVKQRKGARVPPEYEVPKSDHGTHVAGIIGADWRNANVGADDVIVKDVYDLMNLQELNAKQILRGVCPDIQLYDLRVFDRNTGAGDEFAMLAALQFTRYLNASKSKRVIHGVNVSVSLEHNVRSFACGRTPVCEECERAVGSGLVVVAAAGNTGFEESQAALASTYRQSSITDPGNAEGVITVGATHREMPHTYGVSYFSSRGPTGDGRAKPDLVAPGERIFSTTPHGKAATLDGTSQAAPHVSGAAALLMARHSELIGQPARIKKILCSTATDLGRVPQYQGAGVLDVLRALESV